MRDSGRSPRPMFNRIAGDEVVVWITWVKQVNSLLAGIHNKALIFKSSFSVL
jgi:hypothetical protein